MSKANSCTEGSNGILLPTTSITEVLSLFGIEDLKEVSIETLCDLIGYTLVPQQSTSDTHFYSKTVFNCGLCASSETRPCTCGRKSVLHTPELEKGQWICDCGGVNQIFVHTPKLEKGQWICDCGYVNHELMTCCERCKCGRKSVLHTPELEKGQWICDCGGVNHELMFSCEECKASPLTEK